MAPSSWASQSTTSASRHGFDNPERQRYHDESSDSDCDRELSLQLARPIFHAAARGPCRSCDYSAPLDGPADLYQPRAFLRALHYHRICPDYQRDPSDRSRVTNRITRRQRGRLYHRDGRPRIIVQSLSKVPRRYRRSISLSWSDRLCAFSARGDPSAQPTDATAGAFCRATSDSHEHLRA